MKKVIVLTALTGVLAGILVGTAAAGQKPISLIVNGMTQDQFPLRALPSPQIVNGFVMIPAAALSRTFREDVKWDSASRTIEINPDVWKEGGFGYKGEEWPKVRNAITKFLIAVEEQDAAVQAKMLISGYQPSVIGDGDSIMDIQFRDGKSSEASSSYTVRVAMMLYNAKQDRLLRSVQDFVLDMTTLKIERINIAPGGGYLREYNVIPGIEIMTPIEG
ncbi:stalk domain-containing protein [Paenibacillus albus]|uniref:Copper amine oxidase-like N-terminal domain-containing protein n=1 Tax=Paenibacillus albus TaxID=2495582 RepID=A0A3Q8X2P0_9BACL|nr:stalk domain-containing protein [Paenibacillus albus]AZN38334.1 hypothetical protein EJC50_00560 [Paenibacillus albus]